MIFSNRQLRLLLACLISLVSLGLLYLLLPGRHETVWMIASGFFVVLLGYNWLISIILPKPVARAEESPAPAELSLIEVNARIQTLLSVSNVIEVLNEYLGKVIPVCNVRYFLNTEFLPDQSQAGGLYAWGDAEPWMADRLWQFFTTIREIQFRGKTEPRLQDFLQTTDTDAAVPLFHRKHLLGVMLLTCDKSRAHSDEQNEQLFNFLTTQLPTVLDRIRIYSRVWQSKELAHAERVQVMRSLSANIAHEMRTPLSGIRASMSGLENYLPQLLEAYEVARNEKSDYPAISPVHKDSLRATPARIASMIDQANAVIDLLLMNLKDNEAASLVSCDAGVCIREAVERYPFKPGEREQVTLTLDDNFTFMGVEILFIYVIFNLLKNALYSIRSAHKGDISITLKSGEKENSVVVEDTGTGISESVLSEVFDSFFTTKEEGTGAGLTFCKRTMLQFSGDIICESVVGDHARFILHLPKNTQ